MTQTIADLNPQIGDLVRCTQVGENNHKWCYPLLNKAHPVEAIGNIFGENPIPSWCGISRDYWDEIDGVFEIVYEVGDGL